MMEIDYSLIPEGRFLMGNSHGSRIEDGEGPLREVMISSFEISKHSVSNEQFSKFVSATNYKTSAEINGFSHVFAGQLNNPEEHAPAATIAPWWRKVNGANWKKPNGSDDASSRLPVVHMSVMDAVAFCIWNNSRLPTEAEWEKAAQDQKGITPHIWNGVFPNRPKGHVGPLPVDSAPANMHGLVHTCGNVWEWTSDRFSTLNSPRLQTNPKGPLNGKYYVVKGGSFLCSDSYCSRYKPYSRRAELPQASTSHTGFRVSRDVKVLD